MASMGCPLATLAAILGHSPHSIRIISRYVHPTRDEQHNAMLRYGRTIIQPQAGRLM